VNQRERQLLAILLPYPARADLPAGRVEQLFRRRQIMLRQIARDRISLARLGAIVTNPCDGSPCPLVSTLPSWGRSSAMISARRTFSSPVGRPAASLNCIWPIGTRLSTWARCAADSRCDQAGDGRDIDLAGQHQVRRSGLVRDDLEDELAGYTFRRGACATGSHV